ncbi:hypothetical protein V5P93_003353 [Actinokineospora auranticolor]|uniref:Uncharacterized protein n=1 Tax=Actinokineospora auranticolor TaxID=155976 RepID=A0A2S6GPC0_9PSEU|nr:hypothetical protein [Actinokineospora auranticolor]PPK67013.1 hypothetical protein CLV40_1089 [Actinokineospora auranticolor]
MDQVFLFKAAAGSDADPSSGWRPYPPPGLQVLTVEGAHDYRFDPWRIGGVVARLLAETGDYHVIVADSSAAALRRLDRVDRVDLRVEALPGIPPTRGVGIRHTDTMIGAVVRRWHACPDTERGGAG